MVVAKLTATFGVWLLLRASFDYWYPWVSPIVNCVLLLSLSWFIGKKLAKSIIIKKLLPPVDPKGRAVMITGCDSGFGHMTSLALNQMGFVVFSTVLNPEGEGAKELLKKSRNRIQLLKMDVTNSEEVEAAKTKVESFLKDNELGVKELFAVVNNAGIASGGEIEWMSPGSVDDFESHLAVNTLGVIRVTRSFLPLVRKSRGRIVNLSSILGKTSLPGLSAYCVSKAATAKFTEGLQSELARFGVTSIDIEPWFFKTPMLNTKAILDNMTRRWRSATDEVRASYGGESYFKKMVHAAAFTVSHPKNVIQTPQDVVNALVDAVSSPEPDSVYRVISPGFGIVFWIVNDFLPWDLLIHIRRAVDIVPQFYSVKIKER